MEEKVESGQYVINKDSPERKVTNEGAATIRDKKNFTQRFSVKKIWVREFLAEMSGTFVLLCFGLGVNSSQMHAGTNDFLAINWGWAVAVMMGVLVAGGVTGGHLNPAVTVALAVVGKFPWRKVLHYVIAQYVGAFLGASVVYLLYSDSYDTTVMRQSCNFGTCPRENISTGILLFDQVFGTGVLLFCVLAVTDRRNMSVNPTLVPLYVAFVILGIGLSFGFNTGYPINPARDLSPRILSSFFWGRYVFTNNFWIPIVGPHVGGMIGAILYICTIENNWPDVGDHDQTLDDDVFEHLRAEEMTSGKLKKDDLQKEEKI